MKKYVLAGGSADALAVEGEGAAKATSPEFEYSRKGTAQFSLCVKLSGATPVVSLYLLASFDGTNFIKPDDMSSPLIVVSDTNRHIITVPPTLALSYKIQADGDSGNGADTSIDELLVMVISN